MELETLDEALKYLNESLKDIKNGAPYGKTEIKRFISDLLKTNKHKKTHKKKNNNRKSDNPNIKKLSNEQIDIINKNQNIMVDRFKKLYNKIKSTKEFKDKCIESSKKFNDGEYYSDLVLKEGYIPNINISNFEEGIIQVIDDYQMVNVVYSWILFDLVDMYRDEYDDNLCPFFDFGDGDEGCIYFNYYELL